VYRPFNSEKQKVRGDFKKSDPVQFIETLHYPRYYFADQLVPIANNAEFSEKLSNGNYTAQAAFVTRPPFVPARGVVRSIQETANTATLDVESFGQGLLVMSVTNHKYWTVRVDGARVPQIPVNIAYQGIIVTPGKHVVTMEYRNPLVIIGLLISGIAAGALLLIALFSRRRIARHGLDAYEEPVHVVADETGTHIEPAQVP